MQMKATWYQNQKMNPPEKPADDSLPMDKAAIQVLYDRLRKKTLILRLVIYILPLVLLSVYFHFQFTITLTESSKSHLKSIAESQRNTIDLFLQERVVNLKNLLESPKFFIPASDETMQKSLEKLKQDSPTFVDVGLFDERGIHLAYAGPFSFLKNKDYSKEPWFISLMQGNKKYIISDIYLGFRRKPHFTLAVTQELMGKKWVLRATVDPIRFADFIHTLENTGDVFTFIVNTEGKYQSVPSSLGTILESSPYLPKNEPTLGAQELSQNNVTYLSAYSWLHEVNWCLVVLQPLKIAYATMYRTRFIIIALFLVFFIVIVAVISFTTTRFIGLLEKTDIAKYDLQRQLFHAAKLASVGELAAGIAHEINNPLAIIGEEAGLLKDKLDPHFYTKEISPEEYNKHLDIILNAVFRCRDITGKLLGFVRKDEVKLQSEDINEILQEVIRMMQNEFMISNTTVKSDFDENLPEIYTNRNQLQQVLINIINNAIAATASPGEIFFRTMMKGEFIGVAVTDTGCGMTPEQREKIFFPFYTTKQVGKGTGLGLSVSYGIVKSMGGRIEVSSEVGRGSTFEILLPFKRKS